MPPEPGHSPPDDRQRTFETARELGDFGYIVAHDLSASFRHVAEFSRLLLADLECATPKQRLYADRIQGSAEHGQQLIEQLHVYASVHQRDFQPRDCDATRLMESAQLPLRKSHPKSSAAVCIAPLGSVYGDPALLTIAFSHLLHNAIRFHDPGATPRVHVSADTDAAGGWTLHVADNGIGVEPAHRDAAFRMFAQLHPKRFPGGVGAGLPICRAIARRHDGEVRFSDCASGTCAELILPAHQNGVVAK